MKWNLTTIFKTDKQWEDTLKEFKTTITKVIDFKDKLNNKKVFQQYLDYSLSTETTLEHLYVYAMLKTSLNQKDIKSSEQYNKILDLYQTYNSNSSFVNSQIISIGKEKVLSFLDEKYLPHKFHIEVLFNEQMYKKVLMKNY